VHRADESWVEPLRLRLVDSRAFTDGTAIWVYERVGNV
jgi:hypothetical protein